VSHRRRASTRATMGTRVLAGLAEKPMRLVATYRGEKYLASLRRDGCISHKGTLYDSPTSAAKAIVGRAANGWQFWNYRKDK